MPSNKIRINTLQGCFVNSNETISSSQDHGPDHQWLMFLDIDEFLIFRQGPSIQSLPALLYEYENFSALAVHWILFGSSGHDARPLKGVLRSYVRCMPLKHAQHLFVKTIVNTRYARRMYKRYFVTNSEDVHVYVIL